MQTIPVSASRRTLMLGLLAAIPARTVFGAKTPAQARLAEIERGTGGRLGIAALDTGNGRSIAFNANARFPLCSTFKFLAAAAILKRIDIKTDQLDRIVHYEEQDLLDYAPITRQHAGEGGMTLQALCAAAVSYSDNTAGNLLLDVIGGPPALTRFARALGDPITRLDRTEPTLNEAIHGDARDTTSPAMMLRDMNILLLGNGLRPGSQQMLNGWMAANTTGAKSLRAGIPADWLVADKTGSGNATRNDIALLMPPGRKPILVAAYLTEAKVAAEARDDAIAEVGRAVVDYLSK